MTTSFHISSLHLFEEFSNEIPIFYVSFHLIIKRYCLRVAVNFVSGVVLNLKSINEPKVILKACLHVYIIGGRGG